MSRLPGETDEDRDDRLAEVLPIGRAATTGEIASAALWLVSDEAGFVVGHDMVVAGPAPPEQPGGAGYPCARSIASARVCAA